MTLLATIGKCINVISIICPHLTRLIVSLFSSCIYYHKWVWDAERKCTFNQIDLMMVNQEVTNI